jgi:myo-inositol 2-dehydrogenase / D-chiro-inositol 1-dehydrogenase
VVVVVELSRNWNRFNQNTGGTLVPCTITFDIDKVEKCCHFFDLFNRILAPAYPVRVFATGAQDVNHLDEVYENGLKPDILDNAYVLIDYSNGAKAALDLCMFAEASFTQEEVSIVGSKGKLEAFLPQLEVRTGLRGRDHLGDVQIEIIRDSRIKYQGHHHGSSYLEHLDVLATVKSFKSGARHENTAGLEQGTLAVAIGVAAHKSVAEGRPVFMKELLTEAEVRAVERYSDAEPRSIINAAKVL